MKKFKLSETGGAHTQLPSLTYLPPALNTPKVKERLKFFLGKQREISRMLDGKSESLSHDEPTPLP